MRNQEIAKAMKLIGEGFLNLSKAFEMEETPKILGVDFARDTDKTVVSTVNPTTNKVVNTKTGDLETIPTKEATEVKVAEKELEPYVETLEEAKETVNENANTYTEEELNAMTYNEIKALAKELGVKAVGTKKAIIDSILETISNETVEEEVIEDVEETTTDEMEEPVEDVLEDEEEDNSMRVEVDEDDITLYDRIVTDLEGYTDEELADILSDIGVSPKGRRQALLSKIVQAIEEGKLEWEDEESETVEETEEPLVEEPTETEIEDPHSFVGTETRRVACEKECEEIELALEKEEISHKDILKFLKDFYNGKYTSQGFDGDVDEYIAIQCDLIDDEGVKHDFEDPYYIGDDVYCCAQHLKELNGDLYCEICGTTYTM